MAVLLHIFVLIPFYPGKEMCSAFQNWPVLETTCFCSAFTPWIHHQITLEFSFWTKIVSETQIMQVQLQI